MHIPAQSPPAMCIVPEDRVPYLGAEARLRPVRPAILETAVSRILQPMKNVMPDYSSAAFQPSPHGTTRREFLQVAAASSLAIAASVSADDRPAAERTHANKGRIFKSDKGGAIGKTKEEMVAKLRQYKELGFDGLEGGSPDIKDIEALKQAVREVDFPIHGLVDGVHWRQRLSDPDPKVREVGRLALEQAVRDAHALNASTVLLVPGQVNGDNENHDHVWERSITEIRKVLPLASRLGIQILIENVINGFCAEADQYRDYIDEIDSPWVGAYFDIGNHLRFGPAEHWIRTLGRRIVKLDIKDWDGKNFCRLGEGVANWPEIRKALAEIRFTGWATREGRDNSLEDTSKLIDTLFDR